MNDREVIAAAERPWRDEHVEALMRRRAEAQGDAVRATVAAEGRSRSSDPRVAAADWRRLHDPLEVDDVPEPEPEPVEVSGDGYARRGGFVWFSTAGRFDVGIRRDSSLDTHNDYQVFTALWAELRDRPPGGLPGRQPSPGEA